MGMSVGTIHPQIHVVVGVLLVMGMVMMLIMEFYRIDIIDNEYTHLSFFIFVIIISGLPHYPLLLWKAISVI
jgi:hypothetical protein